MVTSLFLNLTLKGRNVICAQTKKMQIEMDYTDDLTITWKDENGRTFASDLRGKSYSYDMTSDNVYHYMSFK